MSPEEISEILLYQALLHKDKKDYEACLNFLEENLAEILDV